MHFYDIRQLGSFPSALSYCVQEDVSWPASSRKGFAEMDWFGIRQLDRTCTNALITFMSNERRIRKETSTLQTSKKSRLEKIVE